MTSATQKSSRNPGAKSVKSAGKAGAEKKTAPGKKRSGKKKAAGDRRALLLAFVAGLLVASAAFWFFRPEPSRTGDEAALRDKRPPALADAGERALQARGNGPGSESPATKETRRAKAPVPPPERALHPAKQGGGTPVTRDVNLQSSPLSGPPSDPPPGKTAPDAAENGTRGPGAPAGGFTPGEPASGDVERAVASALVDLRDLLYEESLPPSLEERIRRVDYALMQAASLRKLPTRALRLSSVEERLQGADPYQYQRIDILPGKNAGDFLCALRECLAEWAEGAALVPAGQDRWDVRFQGVVTHSLSLYPDRTNFFPPPGEGSERVEGALPKAEKGNRIGRPGVSRLPLQASRSPQLPRMRKADQEARLVIVMDDLGASVSAVRSLLALDYPVSFAFWPHGAHTREGADAAHALGREILVHQPMEPVGYPRVQPGPNALLRGMRPERIRRILASSLAAVPHARGMNNHMGSSFTQDKAGVVVVVDFLKERGLFLLDSLTHGRSVLDREGGRLGITRYRRNVFLDVIPTKAKVLEELGKAERIALLTGQAVAIGHPLPETLAALRDWQVLRDKNVRLVRLADLDQEGEIRNTP